MGERKGTNKYYPPDFDPKIHRNLNAYHGTHALRERGRKASQGILIIRFEMPFNCWCLTCKNPIGMGVRYNAQKAKVGMYHSTPIYKFTMPCHLCAGTIVIQTDPQNFDYVILEGARRKHQKWDPEENEQVVIADATEKKKLALDAMYHLEHDVKDKTKSASIGPVLQQLESDRATLKDDFALNQLARKRFREAKRLALEQEEKDRSLTKRLSLLDSEVQLLPEDESDAKTAKIIRLTHMQKDMPSKKSLETAVLFHSHSSKPSSSMRTPSTVSNGQTKSDSSNPVSSASSSTSNDKFSSISIRSERSKQRGQAFSSSAVVSESKLNSAGPLGIRVLSGPPKNTTVGPSVDLVSYEDSDGD